MRIRTVVAAIALLCGTTVAAQQRPPLFVVIEDLDEDAINSAGQKSVLESIAVLTLRNNGVQPSQQVTKPYLYLQMTALNSNKNLCIVGYQVTVRATNLQPRPEFGRFKPRKNFGDIVLCDTGELLSGPQLNMQARVSASMEQKIKVCLGNLDY